MRAIITKFGAFLLCIAISQAAFSKELEDRKWLEVGYKNFTVYSMLSKSDTKELLRRIEVFRAVNMYLTGIDITESPVRTKIFAIEGISAPPQFGVKSSSSGLFQADLRNYWMILNERHGQAEIDIALHQYMHFVLSNSTQLDYPLWIQEGIAGYISATRVREDDIVVGGIPATVARTLYDEYARNWVPVYTVISRDTETAWADTRNNLFFAEAWAIVHYLRNVPDDAAKFNEHVINYTQRVSAGEEPIATFEEIFGVSTAHLNGDLWEYINNERMPGVSIPLREVLTDFYPRSRHMSREEIALELGEFALQHGDIDRAQRWFEVATGKQSLEARVAAGQANVMLAKKNNAAALKHLDRALKLTPEASYVQLDAARYWLDRASATSPGAERDDSLNKALAHVVEAQRLEPRIPESFVVHARILLLGEREIGRAIVLLEQAQRLLPADAGIRFALADAYRAAERFDDADELSRIAQRKLDAAEIAERMHRFLDDTRLYR